VIGRSHLKRRRLSILRCVSLLCTMFVSTKARWLSLEAIIKFLAPGVWRASQVDSLLHPRKGLLAERLAVLIRIDPCGIVGTARRQEGYEDPRRVIDVLGALA
jgi:hypothetical protein